MCTVADKVCTDPLHAGDGGWNQRVDRTFLPCSLETLLPQRQAMKLGSVDLTSSHRYPLGPIIVLVAAAAGVLLGLYYYFTPLTGITGAPGVLLVIGSSVALVLDAFILWFGGRGWLFGMFWVLGLLGALGTIIAAWFLHAWWLAAAIVFVFAGLIVTLAGPSQPRRAAA
ncbi:hypothetical protein HL667_01365 [Bradyrhizobium sp. 83012]|uniref:DUF4175 domain-containing protein n=1 Tax=Bradyrhizobium aeschynomenes TaxID=2734909 RepID=A0ABX2C5T9_9BRAD|nr:hypothetical protein [Bradyrhizobium aeschynomenes]NPU63641.1 hypothetical protein [Bradyrhizobium aeschynomenes]